MSAEHFTRFFTLIPPEVSEGCDHDMERWLRTTDLSKALMVNGHDIGVAKVTGGAIDGLPVIGLTFLVYDADGVMHALSLGTSAEGAMALVQDTMHALYDLHGEPHS